MSGSGNSQQFIWTRWGTLVYCDDFGNLRHSDILAVPRNVFVTEDGILNLAGHHREPVALGPAPDGRLTGISRNRQFYSAEPDGSFSCTRSACGFWEQVLMLTSAELDVIHALRGHDWVLQDGTIIPARDIICEADFKLAVGNCRVELSHSGGITVTECAGGHIAAITLLHGGWRVAVARRFRPLIYFAVFGADHIFDMLKLCLTSIAKYGHYGGHVFILSDREAAAVTPYIPEELHGRTIFSCRDVTDRASMMMERFDISDLPISEFQPILCLDADMVCDAPVTPLLAHCNTAGKFFGSAEFGGVPIGQMSIGIGQWFGRFLFATAGRGLDDVYGLNGGAIAFPNQPAAVPVFGLIAAAFKKSVQDYANFAFMGEQPALSYVLQSLALIDARALNNFIQFRNQCLGTNQRLGFMHFNTGVGVDKLKEMDHYFGTLG